MQHTVWRYLMDYSYDAPRARFLRLSILVLILINCVAVIVESVESVRESHWGILLWLERISVSLFIAEYLLRLWAAPCDPAYRHPLWGRLRWVVSPMGLVDLFAIVPAFFAGADLRSIRILRMIRIFRIFKIARYSRAFRALGETLSQKREEILVTLFVLVILLVMTSSLMYAVEKDAQPEVFSSIPAAMWWSVVTLSTVGYGDTYPETGLGRLVGALAALLGIGLFAMPAAILAGGFIENLSGPKAAHSSTCPHCGEEIGPTVASDTT